MSSTLIDPIATALAALAETITVNGEALRGVWPPARQLPKTPCVELEIPTVEWPDIDQPAGPIGFTETYFTYTATIFFDLAEPVSAQGRLVEALEKWRDAIEGEPSLGLAYVEESVLLDAKPLYDTTTSARPLIAYETTVRIRALVPN